MRLKMGDAAIGKARDAILQTLKKQNGIIFAKPSIVCRESYNGGDIIAKNSRFEKGYVDERGYVPVEWWVMSITEAGNPKRKQGEGLTALRLSDGSSITLLESVDIAGDALFGKSRGNWPLTKILDIGGNARKTSFNTLEAPPIPPHVHSGEIKEGNVVPPGKVEAYFFPPLDVPPYNKKMGKAITRLGLKKGVSKEDITNRLKNFGKDDSMYELLQEYEVQPYTGWTILAGTIHSPGPWLTFEIQFPQDDFNLAAWRLGEKLTEQKQRAAAYYEQGLRGLSENDFVGQVVDWKLSTDPEFKKHFFRQPRTIESGDWGRRIQIFFDMFYGEAWEIEPEKSLTIVKSNEPAAGIVWSGNGMINGNMLNQADEEQREFLAVSGTEIHLQNKGATKLIIFTFGPIRPEAQKEKKGIVKTL
jgi:hypothetical protein